MALVLGLRSQLPDGKYIDYHRRPLYQGKIIHTGLGSLKIELCDIGATSKNEAP